MRTEGRKAHINKATGQRGVKRGGDRLRRGEGPPVRLVDGATDGPFVRPGL